MSVTPVYQSIEFCRDAETLWRKIESKWDWLGTHPRGQFVVGYPKRPAVEMRAASDLVIDGGETRLHGVRWRMPMEPAPSHIWVRGRDQARQQFRTVLEREKAIEGSGIVRVELIDDGKVVAHEFVVLRGSTYR